MIYIYDYQDFVAEGKQKSHSRKLSRRSLSSNLPSCENDAAKIQINRETAIANLEKLEKSYQHTNQIRGFLINIKNALGLKPTQGASGYGVVDIPKEIPLMISANALSMSFIFAPVYANSSKTTRSCGLNSPFILDFLIAILRLYSQLQLWSMYVCALAW